MYTVVESLLSMVGHLNVYVQHVINTTRWKFQDLNRDVLLLVSEKIEV